VTITVIKWIAKQTAAPTRHQRNAFQLILISHPFARTKANQPTRSQPQMQNGRAEKLFGILKI
jgi:hypothetical protein